MNAPERAEELAIGHACTCVSDDILLLGCRFQRCTPRALRERCMSRPSKLSRVEPQEDSGIPASFLGSPWAPPASPSFPQKRNCTQAKGFLRFF
jgi:hypothetical protein